MSITLMSRIFLPHVRVEGTLQVLLLRMADHANDDGWCWPSIANLAAAIRRSPRRTMELRDQLVELGYVEVSYKSGQNGVNRYRISIPPAPPEIESMFHVPRHSAGNRTVRDSAPCDPSQGGQRDPAGSAREDSQSSLRGSAPAPSEIPQGTLRDLRDESSGTISEPPHPPGAGQPGVEVGTTVPVTGSDGTAMTLAQFEHRLVRLLDRLGVASGLEARKRWARITQRNPLAKTLQNRLDLIRWAVVTAEDQGRRVSYASDVKDFVDQWFPADELEPPEAEAAAS